MKRMIGVDPGLTGAIALLVPGEDPVLWDMPVLKIAGKSKFDYHTFGLIFRHIARLGGADGAVVEEVGAMPGQGVTSMFTFGSVFGAIQQALACNVIPIVLVRPARWKKDYRLTQDKDASRRLAMQTWPSATKEFSRVKDDGRAEAALLAKWGSEQ